MSTTRRNNRQDATALLILLMVGITISLLTPDGEFRQWFALVAFLSAFTFVTRYSTRPWSSTPAGIAVMLSMSVTTIYTGHATLMFFYPSVIYGYPEWETVMEIIYLLIALAALYKTRALTRDGSGKGGAVDEDVEQG